MPTVTSTRTRPASTTMMSSMAVVDLAVVEMAVVNLAVQENNG